MTWLNQFVSLMKVSKDARDANLSDTFIGRVLAKVEEVGANGIDVVIVVPDRKSTALGRRWIDAGRKRGLKIWIRLAGKSFEKDKDNPHGLYGAPLLKSPDGLRHLKIHSDWISENRDLLLPETILTTEGEPQNGGILGINRGKSDFYQFSSKEDFNEWLRLDIQTTKLALKAAGCDGVQTGWYGFDGFIGWGNDNPDWTGKSFIEPQTMEMMDSTLCIDHYPQKETMAKDLDDLRKVWPNTSVVIGEMGATHGETPEQLRQILEACKRPYISTLNYWTMIGGNSALITQDFKNTQYFDVVKSFFKN